MFIHPPYPQYPFPFCLVCEMIGSLLVKSPRDFKIDAMRVTHKCSLKIHVNGTQHIPKTGPALITMNHYARDGFSIIWAALAIAAQLPKDQMWLMTNAWMHRQKGFDLIPAAMTKFLFKRIADMYGFITTPPMPPVDGEQVERALGIRAVFQHIRKHPQTTICLAPEGQDYPIGVLGHPPAGTGKFIDQLAQHLNTIIPVGVYEARETLILDFGPAYGLSQIIETNDAYISRLVMEKIAMQLPAGYQMQSGIRK